jgi:hypothetical protein
LGQELDFPEALELLGKEQMVQQEIYCYQDEEMEAEREELPQIRVKDGYRILDLQLHATVPEVMKL